MKAMEQARPLILCGARLVLADEVLAPGWLVAENGQIQDFGVGRPPPGAEDLRGDLLKRSMRQSAMQAPPGLALSMPVLRTVWRTGVRIA